MPGDTQIFELGDVVLQSGAVLPAARLAYKTYGRLNATGDNVVVLPTFYTGSHMRNEGFFGPGRGIDPERHFIVSVNMFGNGLSSSPSNAPAPVDGPRFPDSYSHRFDPECCREPMGCRRPWPPRHSVERALLEWVCCNRG